MTIPKRENLDNKELVGLSVLSFIDENSFINELKKSYMQDLANSGFLEMFSQTFFKQKPETTNLVPFFMLMILKEAVNLKDKEERDWKITLDSLFKTDAEVMETNYQIIKKNHINETDLSTFEFLKQIKDENQKTLFVADMFFDALLHSEFIIISSYYKEYFKKNYTFEN